MATTDYHSWKQDQLCFTMAPLKSVWGQCFEGMPVSHEQLFKLLKLSGQQLFLVVYPHHQLMVAQHARQTAVGSASTALTSVTNCTSCGNRASTVNEPSVIYHHNR